MIRVYCYSRCTTCRKALAWLRERKIGFEVTDLKENPPDEEALRTCHAQSGLPLRRFFNTSGQAYRALNLAEKLPEMSEDEQFRLLASDGMLVKRPLLLAGDRVLVGFREKEWAEVFEKT